MMTPHEIDIEQSLLKDHSNGSIVWWLFDRLYIRYLRRGYRMTDARVKSAKVGGFIIGAYITFLAALLVGFIVTDPPICYVCSTLLAVSVGTFAAVSTIGGLLADRRKRRR